MELNQSERTLGIKVVYYGPAMGGKTTNLQTIHALTDRESRTELMSIATRDDRTLFFDLLPMGLGKFFGFELKLKLYTVPGQIQFDLTRRRVLAGADAVIFVADSQQSQFDNNAQSMKNLRINLIQNKLDPNAIPLVIQFNKQDLPDLAAPDKMNDALNERGVSVYRTIATSGVGVMESLSTAVADAIERMVSVHGIASEAEGNKAREAVRATLMAYAVRDSQAALPGTSAAAGTPAGKSANAGPAEPAQGADPNDWRHTVDAQISDDLDLLEQAITANMALSEHAAQARILAERVKRRDRQVKAIGALARIVEESADPAAVEKALVSGALQALGLNRASLLIRPESGGMDTRAAAGHSGDPLTEVSSPPAGSLAERYIATGRPFLSNDLRNEVFFGDAPPVAEGIVSLLFSPLQAADGSFGGLFLYGCDPGEQFDATDELFVEALCRVFSLARLKAPAAAAR